MYGITLLRKNVPLLPQLPQLPQLPPLPLTTTLIQPPLIYRFLLPVNPDLVL